MTHPVYAPNDPKSGQPVLIGEKLWNPRTQAMSTVAWIDANGMPVLDDHDALFPPYLSTPPAPAIEACVCGSRDVEYSDERYRVECDGCGRCGEAFAPITKPGDAIASWNADMRALKHEPQANEPKHVPSAPFKRGDTAIYHSIGVNLKDVYPDLGVALVQWNRLRAYVPFEELTKAT